MEPVIRQALTAEIERFSNLEKECFLLEECAGYDKLMYRHKVIPELTLGCFLQDQLLGMINGCQIASQHIPNDPKRKHIPDGESVYISVLCVRDGYRNKGFATKLLHDFIEIVKQSQSSVKWILLVCKDHLIQFYQKAGFVCNGKSEAEFEILRMSVHHLFDYTVNFRVIFTDEEFYFVLDAKGLLFMWNDKMSQVPLESVKKMEYTPYPNKFVTVKIVKVGHTANFTGAGGIQGQILNFVVADQQTAMLGTLNDPSKFTQLKEGKSFIIRNFVVKGTKLVCTEKTKFLQTKELPLSQQHEQAALHMLIPPSPSKTVKEARLMPIKQVLTVSGEVVKDEAIRTVKVTGSDTMIRTITIKEDGECMDVTLWRNLANHKLTVGNYIKISNCITGEWQKLTVLNTSRNSVIEEIEVPEITIQGTLCGVTTNQLESDIAVDINGDLQDFVVETSILRASFDLSQIYDILPIKVKVSTKGTSVISISEVEEDL